MGRIPSRPQPDVRAYQRLGGRRTDAAPHGYPLWRPQLRRAELEPSSNRLGRSAFPHSMSSSPGGGVRWLAETRSAAADSIPNVARGLTVQRCVAAAD